MADSFKLLLRQSRQQVRSNLPLEYQQVTSTKIGARIRGMEEYRRAKRIALYQAIRGEVSLTSIWHTAPLQGKYCYFPVLTEEKHLLFLPATPTTPFVQNQYGIFEPDIPKSQALAPELLDIIFMPLVVFDDYGTRLGMGSGYYDRTLAEVKKPLLIGIAYEFQHYPYIEPQSWDIPMAAVVTQNKIHWSKK